MVTKGQSRNLDVLRACAVLSVFLGHGVMTLLGHANYLIASAARFGVMAFFVHTAFVLMESLDRLEADERGRVTGRFYLRRIFRIYPLSIVAVLIVAAFHIPQVPWKSVIAPTGRVVLSNVLLVQNLTRNHDILAPLWSLPFEVQMYLVLPLIYVGVTRWKINPLAIAAVVALANLPFLPQRWTEFLAYFPCFLAGVAAYRISRNQAGRFSIAVLLAALVILCFGYSVSRDSLHNHLPASTYLSSANDWLCSLAIGLLLPHIREIREGPLSKAAHWIAKYSYGIYLSHVIVMWFAWTRMAGSPAWLRVLTFVVGAVGVPIVAYHLLEDPAVKLGKKLADGLRKPRALAISQAR